MAAHGDVPPIMSVTNVDVEPEFRRRRVATFLYETVAETLWSRWGALFASDLESQWSPDARGFWEKRLAVGKAYPMPWGWSPDRRCVLVL